MPIKWKGPTYGCPLTGWPRQSSWSFFSQLQEEKGYSTLLTLPASGSRERKRILAPGHLPLQVHPCNTPPPKCCSATWLPEWYIAPPHLIPRDCPVCAWVGASAGVGGGGGEWGVSHLSTTGAPELLRQYLRRKNSSAN